MKALITGINGQDGSYLAELLLSKGYNVYGIVRRNSVSESQQYRLGNIKNKITTFYGDLTDTSSLERILSEIKPDEIYNLAAQSHVRISFDIPLFTANVNAIGVLNILEAYRKYCPKAKFYQASSSEMFGASIDSDGFQREETPMNPMSPYGVAKVFGYNMVRHYRRAYKLHACNGILFNHESPRRASNFVTQKIIKTACAIKRGEINKLELGNIDSFRDWGHSKDYVKAMYLITNYNKPDDFVVATGETHSVKQMCEIVFTYLNLDYRDFLIQNPKYIRPEELKYLKGDSAKIKRILGWEPKYTFKSLIKEMIDHELSNSN